MRGNRMPLSDITVQDESPASQDAVMLLDALSDALEGITGSGGRASFDINDMDDPKAVFAVARDSAGLAVGCGALRPMDMDTAEIKRVFAREQGKGVGSAVVEYLEQRAKALGFTALRLETRVVNERAVTFYLSLGYVRIPNYGRYAGREEAVCFGKTISASPHATPSNSQAAPTPLPPR